MSVMNIDGIRILAEVARDIVCNKKYRKADGELTPEQFDRQVKQVLDIVKRNGVQCLKKLSMLYRLLHLVRY